MKLRFFPPLPQQPLPPLSLVRCQGFTALAVLVSAWHKKYNIYNQGAPCSRVCSCGSSVPAGCFGCFVSARPSIRPWCLTQPYRKSAAGQSRGINTSHTHLERESYGLGNPVVMRSCLNLQRDIAVLAGALRKKIRRLFHPPHLVWRAKNLAL